MTDRDRLIELFQEMDRKPELTCPNIKTDESCKGCKYELSNFRCNQIARKVDYLLANGVIIPPCKVGDTVWHKEEGYLLDSYKIKFIYNDMTASNISRDLLFSVEDIGKTVFLTKEEAEAELEKRGDSK